MLQRDGPDFLATWRPPLLTWTELQQLKAEVAAGNAVEAPRPGKAPNIMHARTHTSYLHRYCATTHSA